MNTDFSAPDDRDGRGLRPQQDQSNDAAPVVWDRAGMMDRLMEDEELVDAVLQEFLLDLPDQVEQLQRSVREEDPSQVGRRAHCIKGMAANVGAEALRAFAYELEQAGDAGDMGLIRRGIAALPALCEETQAVIRQHLGEGA
ncbi:MAG: Hpt domain-containing protein [Opitutales bacterium]